MQMYTYIFHFLGNPILKIMFFLGGQPLMIGGRAEEIEKKKFEGPSPGLTEMYLGRTQLSFTVEPSKHGVAEKIQTDGRVEHRQCPILRLARFTKPVPDNELYKSTWTEAEG